jgi:hypothetical protein
VTSMYSKCRGARWRVAVLVSLVCLGMPRLASADPKVEERARALQRKAIEEDNLNVAYGEAIRKLSVAIDMCKASACTPKLRAEILRDLGAMHVLAGSGEEGKRYFAQALALDGTLTLDSEYSTPAVEKVWASVRRDAATLGEPSASAQGAGSPAPSSPAQRVSNAGQCSTNDDCPSGVCSNGTCRLEAPPEPEAPEAPRERRFWIGIWGSLDFAIMPSADQACLLNQSTAAPVNTVGYYCTDSQGNDFPLRNDLGAQNKLVNTNPQYGDSVDRGAVVGDVRLGLSFDYALGENFLLGARAGYVLRTYPGQVAQQYGNGFAAPLHFEARVAYLIGANALHSRFAPLVFVNGGVAESDGALPVQVLLNNPGGGTGQDVPVKAWAVGGPAFAGGGVGLRALLDPRFALTVAGKFAMTFGASTPPLPLISPEVSAAIGF